MHARKAAICTGAAMLALAPVAGFTGCSAPTGGSLADWPAFDSLAAIQEASGSAVYVSVETVEPDELDGIGQYHVRVLASDPPVDGAEMVIEAPTQNAGNGVELETGKEYVVFIALHSGENASVVSPVEGIFLVVNGRVRSSGEGTFGLGNLVKSLGLKE
ncbi:MAG: hypothetical protein LBS27_05560 [Bifidobacteriaceae bacterium]|jgi:hypothetical protein|nr:hypothetical protein [Bifidobacteriaceae bacterium]